MDGKEVRSLLQLSERWPCHIWIFAGMIFASPEINLSLGRGLLVNPFLLFLLDPPSGRSPYTTEILLTWM